jgi:hypothetical protein
MAKAKARTRAKRKASARRSTRTAKGRTKDLAPRSGRNARGGADASNLSDLNQATQLKLQQATESYSRAQQTLSNMLKKSADTQSTIVGNMK